MIILHFHLHPQFKYELFHINFTSINALFTNPVYKFECDLCKEDNVRYTALHLHQRISAHKCSAIGKHLEQHGLLRTGMVDKQFSVLKKCRSKFGCLIFEMLFIKELNPEINTHKNNVEAPAPASAPAPPCIRKLRPQYERQPKIRCPTEKTR